MSLTKLKPVRSEKYKAWIKTLDCSQCYSPGSDPHHCIGFDGIMGSTADDSMLVPMCRECHTSLHNDLSWDKQGILQAQLKWLQVTFRRAVVAGVSW